jgi:hypothetical protein
VADGNFKADHVRQKNEVDDVWLSEGSGMIPKRQEYFDFLATAIERLTVSILLSSGIMVVRHLVSGTLAQLGHYLGCCFFLCHRFPLGTDDTENNTPKIDADALGASPKFSPSCACASIFSFYWHRLCSWFDIHTCVNIKPRMEFVLGLIPGDGDSGRLCLNSAN